MWESQKHHCATREDGGALGWYFLARSVHFRAVAWIAPSWVSLATPPDRKIIHATLLSPQPNGSAVVLQRTQEIQDVLFLGLWQGIEHLDDRVCFGGVTIGGATALMRLNRLEQVRCAAVMEKKNPLAHPPQWSGAKLSRARLPLRDPIGQACTHDMEQE